MVTMIVIISMMLLVWFLFTIRNDILIVTILDRISGNGFGNRAFTFIIWYYVVPWWPSRGIILCRLVITIVRRRLRRFFSSFQMIHTDSIVIMAWFITTKKTKSSSPLMRWCDNSRSTTATTTTMNRIMITFCCCKYSTHVMFRWRTKCVAIDKARVDYGLKLGMGDILLLRGIERLFLSIISRSRMSQSYQFPDLKHILIPDLSSYISLETISFAIVPPIKLIKLIGTQYSHESVRFKTSSLFTERWWLFLCKYLTTCHAINYLPWHFYDYFFITMELCSWIDDNKSSFGRTEAKYLQILSIYLTEQIDYSLLYQVTIKGDGLELIPMLTHKIFQ